MLDRNVKLSIPCPKCKHDIPETIARLEKNPTLTCPACSTSFAIEADGFRRELEEVEQSLTKFKRNMTINIKL